MARNNSGIRVKVLTFAGQLSLLVTKVHPLPSYDDINFRITTAETAFILKIFNGDISADRQRIDEQVQYQFLLKNNGILVPGIQNDVHGNLQSFHMFTTKDQKEVECAVRLLDYVPGDTCQKLPIVESFFYDIGFTCGKMHCLMENNSHHFPRLYKLRHEWSLETVISGEWIDKIHCIDSLQTQSKVKDVINQFECFLESNKDLPSGIVHGDINSVNIIGEAMDSNVVLRAIIDFGDVYNSFFMFDLAICLLYMMVAAKIQKYNYYLVAKKVLMGYESIRKLSEDEKNGLGLAISARACQSVIGGYHTSMLEPHNREYLMCECLVSEQLLHEIDPSKLNKILFSSDILHA